MKLWEALKIHDETGRKIRPIAPSGDYAFLPFHGWLKGNSRESANNLMLWDWEVEPAKVEVTRERVEKAFSNHWSKLNLAFYSPGEFREEVLRELGL